MTDKYIEQYHKAKSAIQLLQNFSENCLTYDELQCEVNNFISYIQKHANEKNNRPNKGMIALKEFFENEVEKPRTLKNVVKKSRLKKLAHKITYKDYMSEIIILRKRGYSLQQIADYCKKHFKVKVGKTTIYDTLKKLEDNSNDK